MKNNNMNNLPSVQEYRKYNPYTESIILGENDVVIIIDRYDIDDYGAWWTDGEHLYDETYGASCRGTFEDVIHNIKDDIK